LLSKSLSILDRFARGLFPRVVCDNVYVNDRDLKTTLTTLTFFFFFFFFFVLFQKIELTLTFFRLKDGKSTPSNADWPLQDIVSLRGFIAQ